MNIQSDLKKLNDAILIFRWLMKEDIAYAKFYEQRLLVIQNERNHLLARLAKQEQKV